MLDLADHAAREEDLRTLFSMPWCDWLIEPARDVLVEALQEYDGDDVEMAELLLQDLLGGD